MTARRFGVVFGVVLGLLVPSSAASATTTAPIVSVVAYCDVNDLRGLPACPRESQRITGYAAATATADVAARTFRVSAVAQPNRRFVQARYASGLVELQSSEVTSSGGPVKVVLTNLSGGNATRCPRMCETLGHASAATGVWVHLQLRGGGGSEAQQALCTITYQDEQPVPPSFVVPDDCGPDVTLEAPPHSTFTVGIRLIAQADAEGGAARAQSALAGEVHEIRVP